MDNERIDAPVEEQQNTERTAADAAQQRPMQQRPFNNRRRKKVCQFCADKVDFIDYKDVIRLRKFVSERAKILPRRISGVGARHQRQLTIAIKRARQVALMPFLGE